MSDYMAQYCRYCSNANCYDGEEMIYCDVRKITYNRNYACRTNTCKDFSLNEIDVYDLEKRYKPRENKSKDYEQLSLLESEK